VKILPLFLEACQNFSPMDEDQQEALMASSPELQAVTIFD
jgi:hypothetical protein